MRSPARDHNADTPSTAAEFSKDVRRIGHDLRNLLTIFYGVTDTLESLPKKDPEIEGSLTLLQTLAERLQALADRLRDVGRSATYIGPVDAQVVARELSALEPSFGPLVHAYRSAPPLRARDGDLIRLWTVMVLGAQRLGGFREIAECEIVDLPGIGSRCRLDASFARAPLPQVLCDQLTTAARDLGATLDLVAEQSSISVAIPVA